MGQGRLLFCRSLVEAAHKYNTCGELQVTKKNNHPSKFHVFCEGYNNLMKSTFFGIFVAFFKNQNFNPSLHEAF